MYDVPAPDAAVDPAAPLVPAGVLAPAPAPAAGVVGAPGVTAPPAEADAFINMNRSAAAAVAPAAPPELGVAAPEPEVPTAPLP
jgi:hypothetical protein